MSALFSDTVTTHIYRCFGHNTQTSCQLAKQNKRKQNHHKSRREKNIDIKHALPFNIKCAMLGPDDELKKLDETNENGYNNDIISNCHCVWMHKTETHLCSRSSFSHQSQRPCKVNIRFLPAFFKILLFFVIFDNFAVSASPISHIAMMKLRKSFQIAEPKDKVLYRGSRSVEVAIQQASNKYPTSAQLPSNSRPIFLLRKPRNTLSDLLPCEGRLKIATSLTGSAYNLANKFNKTRTKKRNISRYQSSSTEKFCSEMHSHFQDMKCDAIKAAHLFEDNADNIENYLNVVIELLREDMNTTNPSDPTCNHSSNESDVVTAQRLVHHLFINKVEFQTKCTDHDNKFESHLCKL